jgi:hypothetical protein
MRDLSNRQDEVDLERRIEQQRLLVARLLNESKRTAEANEALYRLCQRLAQLRYQKNMHAGAEDIHADAIGASRFPASR